MNRTRLPRRGHFAGGRWFELQARLRPPGAAGVVTRVPVQEGERDLALRVYALAMRAKASTLRVHTVALGACLLRGDAVDTHASDLATAMTVHRNVQVRPLPEPAALSAGDRSLVQVEVAPRV